MIRHPNTQFRSWIRTGLLLGALVGLGGLLAAWKYSALREASASTAHPPEPVESVTSAVARERQHQETITSIGTVLALQSVTLRNEVPGTVRQVMLRPGDIVETGSVLVALDVSVEEA